MQPIPKLTPQPGIKLRDKLGLPGWGALLFIPVILLLLLALLIFVVLGGPHTIDGSSMYPALHNGDRVFITKHKSGSMPKRGDIVSLKDPTGDPVNLIKRVFAVGGDTIICEGGLLMVKGQKPYEKVHCLRPGPAKLLLPKNMIFVVGDNEKEALDSRVFGPVPVNYVKGKAVLILWPLNRIRRL